MEWMFSHVYLPSWLYYSVPMITISSGFMVMLISTSFLITSFGVFALGYGFGIRSRRHGR